jgi:uncharacterized protein (TIGR03437 family)
MRTNTASKGFWFAVAFVLLAPLLLRSYDGSPQFGPPASGYTGGFGEPTCVECHVSFPLNSGRGTVTITVSSSSGSVTSYSSGAAYQVTVNVSDPAQQKWGFELSARTLAGRQAGTITIGADGFTQLLQSFNGIQYIAHTFKGTRNGTTSGVDFTFGWTAPNISAGEIVFSAAGNAANGDSTPFNDYIYDTFLTLQPQAVGPAPSVYPAGTVNGASFAPGSTPIAAGSIAAIFGTNLDDGSMEVSSLGADGKLPTSLGGASVTFSGVSTPAPIFAAFPSQLNVEIPQELAGATSATVQVTVNGQASAPQIVPLGPLSPGIFTIPAGGTGQGAIQIANANPPTFAAPQGSIPGAPARPASIGEFLTIYCTGLGAVTNPPATGEPALGNPDSETIATPHISIGGVPATVSFSGLAPTFVGLYQVNVQVPAGTPSGSAVPLTLSIGGVPSNAVTVAIAGP